MNGSGIELTVDGLSLRCDDVASFAAGGSRVRLDPLATAAAEKAWRLMDEAASRRMIYGRSTGVGAKKTEEAVNGLEHGMSLLRSHAGGVGELMNDEQVRAMLLIRLNQLSTGRSGAHPRLLDTLVDALNANALPAVHRMGAIGTGDLTALAEVGLTFAGELPLRSGELAPVPLGSGEALALMSSNAATLAESVIATVELRELLMASHAVAALSYIAMKGSPEAYAAAVHAARPHRGQTECATAMRFLLGLDKTPIPGRSIQDPYGLRAFPQVQGPALDAVRHLEDVLDIEINAGTENPMISPNDGTVYHHGNFHTAYVATGLDQLRATVHHVAGLSATRISHLMRPEQTDVPAFLTAGTPGSSGMMILEYVAHDALAELRQLAIPVTLGTAVVSHGLEDHASFSTQAARHTARAADLYRVVLGCELVAATRALQIQEADIAGLPVHNAYDKARSVLESSLEDRPLSSDIERAAAILDSLGHPVASRP